MRTAILSVLFAVISIAAPQQDPSQPASGHQPNQQKPPEPPLSVQCAAATTIQLGVPYNSQAIASGGTGAYQFAVTGGALPAGIALNPATWGNQRHACRGRHFLLHSSGDRLEGRDRHDGSTPCTLQLPAGACRRDGAAVSRPGFHRAGATGPTPAEGAGRPSRQRSRSRRSTRRSWLRRGIRRSQRPRRRCPRTIIPSFWEPKTRSR